MPRFVAIALAIAGAAAAVRADAITISGNITQDAGGNASANPGLNSIVFGDAYNVTLNFSGTIASPGTYSLTSILFSDPAAGASESAFISGSMTITQAGAVDQFSVLGCLIDSVTCLLGNELDLNFQIPAAQLNQAGVTAQAIPALLPLDLLEDGGSTDVQGSVTGYSYAAASTVPEPSTIGLLGCALAGLIAIRIKKTKLGGM